MKPVIPQHQILPILQLMHNCDLCRTGTKCCCASFDVCITEDEVERIDGVMPQVAEYVPHVIDEHGNFENVFEETDDGFFSIDTHDDGLCIFAYHKEGETRCSIHSVALDMGIPLESVKPQVCMLWPIAISDDVPQQLGVDVATYDFHCNHEKSYKNLKLDPNLKEALRTQFGNGILAPFEFEQKTEINKS